MAYPKPVVCIECGTTFYVPARAAHQAKFCSSHCRNARDRREQRHKRLPQTQLTCEHCGKPFFVRRSIAKVQRYCSQKCSGAAIGATHTGAQNAKWKPKLTIICDYCGIEFQTYPSRQERRRYCCKEHRILGNLHRLAQSPRTNLEIAMRKALEQANLAFEEQSVMYGKFIVDFRLTNCPIIIQCDGTYWHDRPKTKDRDKGQDRYLAKAGYIVLRFNDRQILHNLNACIKSIKRTIETGQMPLLNY